MDGPTKYFGFDAKKIVGSTLLENFCWSPLQLAEGLNGWLRAVLKSAFMAVSVMTAVQTNPVQKA